MSKRNSVSEYLIATCLALALATTLFARDAKANQLASWDTPQANAPLNASSSDVKAIPIIDWLAWPTVGRAQLTWFVFDVYQSRLKTPNGRYIISRDITPHSLALEINYQREISSEQLLEATDDQWQKLGLTAQQRQQGLARFRALFPTVQPGDQLTYVTDGQLGALYFSQGADVALLGYIEQEWLNDAFLAIWLSPKTAYPKLRQQLIAER